MRGLLSNNGSVEDIRNSLYFVKPVDPEDARELLKWLQESLDDEVKNRNRSTVIKLIQSKVRLIKKQFQPWRL